MNTEPKKGTQKVILPLDMMADWEQCQGLVGCVQSFQLRGLTQGFTKRRNPSNLGLVGLTINMDHHFHFSLSEAKGYMKVVNRERHVFLGCIKDQKGGFMTTCPVKNSCFGCDQFGMSVTLPRSLSRGVRVRTVFL